MPFELKVIDTLHCPRCNAIAEYRIDQQKNDSKFIPVYLVCKICKLNRYSHTTTMKAILLHRKVKRMKERLAEKPNPRLEARIRYLEKNL